MMTNHTDAEQPVPSLSRGDIFFYPYLWTWERDRYGDAPHKDREVVAASIYELDGHTCVLTLPITTTEPYPDQHAYELPPEEVTRISRGGATRLWVRIDECNTERLAGSQRLAGAEPIARLDHAVFMDLYRALHARLEARDLSFVNRS